MQLKTVVIKNSASNKKLFVVGGLDINSLDCKSSTSAEQVFDVIFQKRSYVTHKQINLPGEF